MSYFDLFESYEFYANFEDTATEYASFNYTLLQNLTNIPSETMEIIG